MLRKLVCTALAGCVCAFAGNAIIWHYGNFKSNKKTCSITSWSGSQPSSGKLTVPSTYTHSDGVTYTVTTIGSHAMDNLTEVTEIVIPAEVVNIGKAIKEQYVNLNGDAENFFNCPKLQKFTVNSSNTMFKSSSGGALYYKTTTAVLRVPQKMSISNGVFKMPDDCSHVAPNAFSECTTVTKVRISGSCTIGDNGGFNRAPNLAEFEVMSSPSFVKVVNGALLTHDSESLISIPPASNISSISFSSNVKTIEPEACYNCVNLKSIKFPGLVELNKWAFKGSGIETLDFPASISTFDTESVAGAKSLKSINFKAPDIRLMVGFARDCTALQTVTTTHPFKELEDCAFAGCRGLKSFPFNGATDLEGDSIFYNCGLEKVVYEPSINKEEWSGAYTFCLNRQLVEIDASTLQGTDQASFCIPSPYAKDCLQLATLKLPPYTGFIHYGSGLNDDGLFIPAFENTKILHIELGCFWIEDNDYKFRYSPFNGMTDIRPNVYVVTTRCSDPENDLYNTWPLKYLFQGNNGAVVSPSFYCDARVPAPKYVADKATYYVPGGCTGYYTDAIQAGCEVREMFGFDIQRLGTNMRITARTYDGVSDLKIAFNGGSAQPLPLDIVYYPELRYDEINEIMLTYKKDGVEMSTYYPSSHWFTTSVEQIVGDGDGALTVYDLNGRLLLHDARQSDLEVLAPGIYIISERGVARKFVKE